MNRVVHFEISTAEPERAAEFYRALFGWEIGRWEGPVDYWLVKTGPEGTPGIDGGIKYPSNGHTGTVNTVGVASVDEALAAVARLGGKALTPKMAIPGVGYHAYAADPLGGIFGLMQDDPSAR